MESIKAFLSYSSKNKKLAGKIQKEFKKIGINVFVAHQSIRPSKEWKAEIKKEINEATWCLPLITGAFRKSHWTDQEVGMCIALSKEIFPLCLCNAKIHGFISDYQAIRFKSNDIEGLCKSFIAAMSENDSGIRYKSLLIDSLKQSPDFTESNKIVEKLQGLSLTTNEKKRILEAAKKNNQIGGGRRGINGWGYNNVRSFLINLESSLPVE